MSNEPLCSAVHVSLIHDSHVDSVTANKSDPSVRARGLLSTPITAGASNSAADARFPARAQPEPARALRAFSHPDSAGALRLPWQAAFPSHAGELALTPLTASITTETLSYVLLQSRSAKATRVDLPSADARHSFY
jgi:hypothetical protein